MSFLTTHRVTSTVAASVASTGAPRSPQMESATRDCTPIKTGIPTGTQTYQMGGTMVERLTAIPAKIVESYLLKCLRQGYSPGAQRTRVPRSEW